MSQGTTLGDLVELGSEGVKWGKRASYVGMGLLLLQVLSDAPIPWDLSEDQRNIIPDWTVQVRGGANQGYLTLRVWPTDIPWLNVRDATLHRIDPGVFGVHTEDGVIPVLVAADPYAQNGFEQATYFRPDVAIHAWATDLQRQRREAAELAETVGLYRDPFRDGGIRLPYDITRWELVPSVDEQGRVTWWNPRWRYIGTDGQYEFGSLHVLPDAAEVFLMPDGRVVDRHGNQANSGPPSVDGNTVTLTASTEGGGDGAGASASGDDPDDRDDEAPRSTRQNGWDEFGFEATDPEVYMLQEGVWGPAPGLEWDGEGPVLIAQNAEGQRAVLDLNANTVRLVDASGNEVARYAVDGQPKRGKLNIYADAAMLPVGRANGAGQQPLANGLVHWLRGSHPAFGPLRATYPRITIENRDPKGRFSHTALTTEWIVEYLDVDPDTAERLRLEATALMRELVESITEARKIPRGPERPVPTVQIAGYDVTISRFSRATPGRPNHHVIPASVVRRSGASTLTSKGNAPVISLSVAQEDKAENYLFMALSSLAQQLGRKPTLAEAAPHVAMSLRRADLDRHSAQLVTLLGYLRLAWNGHKWTAPFDPPPPIRRDRSGLRAEQINQDDLQAAYWVIDRVAQSIRLPEDRQRAVSLMRDRIADFPAGTKYRVAQSFAIHGTHVVLPPDEVLGQNDLQQRERDIVAALASAGSVGLRLTDLPGEPTLLEMQGIQVHFPNLIEANGPNWRLMAPSSASWSPKEAKTFDQIPEEDLIRVGRQWVTYDGLHFGEDQQLVPHSEAQQQYLAFLAGAAPGYLSTANLGLLPTSMVPHGAEPLRQLKDQYGIIELTAEGWRLSDPSPAGAEMLPNGPTMRNILGVSPRELAIYGAYAEHEGYLYDVRSGDVAPGLLGNDVRSANWRFVVHRLVAAHEMGSGPITADELGVSVQTVRSLRRAFPGVIGGDENNGYRLVEGVLSLAQLRANPPPDHLKRLEHPTREAGPYLVVSEGPYLGHVYAQDTEQPVPIAPEVRVLAAALIQSGDEGRTLRRLGFSPLGMPVDQLEPAGLFEGDRQKSLGVRLAPTLAEQTRQAELDRAARQAFDGAPEELDSIPEGWTVHGKHLLVFPNDGAPLPYVRIGEDQPWRPYLLGAEDLKRFRALYAGYPGPVAARRLGFSNGTAAGRWARHHPQLVQGDPRGLLIPSPPPITFVPIGADGSFTVSDTGELWQGSEQVPLGFHQRQFLRRVYQATVDSEAYRMAGSDYKFLRDIQAIDDSLIHVTVLAARGNPKVLLFNEWLP